MMKNYFKFILAFFTITIFLVSCGRGSDSPNPPATDTQKPTTPTNLTTNNITTNSFTLNWSASTDNVGVTGYIVYVNSTTFSTTATTLDITGLSSATSYTVYVKAKDAAGNISDKSNTLSVTTLNNVIPASPSASLLQPVISVSSFRALQLNACSNENFTVSFSTSSAQRTLQSATFTLSGDGAGAYRSLRYRPAGDFTQPWKQVDFSGNSVTVPFSVIIPAGLTAKYDLKVCTKASVNGIANGSNTSMQVSSITTDESGVNAPVGSTFQAAVSLPALDLVTIATFITSSVIMGGSATPLVLAPNQTITGGAVQGFSNNKATGPNGATFAGFVLYNQYGSSNINLTGNWITYVDTGTTSNSNTISSKSGDYYNIVISNATLQTNGSNTHYSIGADRTSGSNGFSSITGFGMTLKSKWDVTFKNSNGNDINLTDVAVYNGSTLLTN